jgi:hypothetical protein
MNRLLSLIVVILGMACLGIGSFFIYQGVTNNNFLVDAMRTEKITLGLTEEQISAGEVIDTMAELQRAGDTIREHRHSIAPTYNEALGGGQFDPTNPQHVTYSQAMNLENYLYLGALSFGVVQLALGSGVFMIVVAIALWVIGIVLWKMARFA